jgi:hypothetical protein
MSSASLRVCDAAVPQLSHRHGVNGCATASPSLFLSATRRPKSAVNSSASSCCPSVPVGLETGRVAAGDTVDVGSHSFRSPTCRTMTLVRGRTAHHLLIASSCERACRRDDESGSSVNARADEAVRQARNLRPAAAIRRRGRRRCRRASQLSAAHGRGLRAALGERSAGPSRSDRHRRSGVAPPRR